MHREDMDQEGKDHERNHNKLEQWETREQTHSWVSPQAVWVVWSQTGAAGQCLLCLHSQQPCSWSSWLSGQSWVLTESHQNTYQKNNNRESHINYQWCIIRLHSCTLHWDEHWPPGESLHSLLENPTHQYTYSITAWEKSKVHDPTKTSHYTPGKLAHHKHFVVYMEPIGESFTLTFSGIDPVKQYVYAHICSTLIQI